MDSPPQLPLFSFSLFLFKMYNSLGSKNICQTTNAMSKSYWFLGQILATFIFNKKLNLDSSFPGVTYASNTLYGKARGNWETR